MERGVTSAKLPYVDRRRCARYGPYVAELAERRAFCKRLANTSVGPTTPVSVAYQAIHAIVAEFRLPDRGYYSRRDWADILAFVLVASEPALPPRFHSADFVEIQFEFGATGREMFDSTYPPPIVEAAKLEVWTDLSPTELRARVTTQCLGPLQRFRKRAARAIRATRRPRFDVRVLAFEPRALVPLEAGPGDPWPRGISLPDPIYTERVLTNFTVDWAARRHLRTIAKAVAVQAAPSIQTLVRTAAGKGRLPSAKRHARWWAMHVFDGKSPEEISYTEPLEIKGPGVTPRIERALRVLGVRP